MTVKEFNKEYGFTATKDAVRYGEVDLNSEIVENNYGDFAYYTVYAVVDWVNRSIEIEYRCQEFDIITDSELDIRDYILEYLK